jgi:hypothetical protein
VTNLSKMLQKIICAADCSFGIFACSGRQEAANLPLGF